MQLGGRGRGRRGGKNAAFGLPLVSSVSLLPLLRRGSRDEDRQEESGNEPGGPLVLNASARLQIARVLPRNRRTSRSPGPPSYFFLLRPARRAKARRTVTSCDRTWRASSSARGRGRRSP